MGIGKDTSYNLAAATAPALFMLAVVPLYIPVIGPDRFGVLAICWTIIAALQFASLGMGPALIYHLAAMHDGPVEARSSLVWTALLLGLAASIVGSILVFGVGEFYFRTFFRSDSALDAEIRRALPVLAALLPLAILIGVMHGALQGVRRFGALSGVSILNAALVAFTPLAVATFVGVRLDLLIIGTVGANALGVLVELVICVKLLPLSWPRLPTQLQVGTLLGYGAWMSGTALIAPLVMLLDRLVIGALRGPAAVTVYVLPFNLVQQLVLLPASVTNAVLPRLAPLEDHEVRQLQSSTLMWLNGMLTPLCVVAIAMAAPFFHVWIGPTLARTASPVAAILLLGGWVHGIGHMPSTIVVGRNRPDLLTKLLLAYLFPYLAILYFATLHFGVMGAAAAWTLRAGFDPVLFYFTRPSAADISPVITSSALVLGAMTTALILPWISPFYWAAMITFAAAACLQHRMVLGSALRQLHGFLPIRS